MGVVPVRGIDPVIEDAEVITALFRLDLLPGDGHKNRIDMHPRQFRKDEIGLGGGSGRRVPEFAAEYQKRFAIDDELPGTVLHSYLRRLDRACQSRRETSDAQEGEQIDESEDGEFQGTPFQCTRTISRHGLFLTRFLHYRDESSSEIRNFQDFAGLQQGGGYQFTSNAQGLSSGADELRGSIRVDATGRDHWDLRQRSLKSPDVFRST